MSDKKFVIIGFNLFCEWQKAPPAYRLYVDDELLTERTYNYRANPGEGGCATICINCSLYNKNVCKKTLESGTYLHEILPLELPPGKHHIRLETLGKKAKFNIRNLQVKEGPVNIIDSTTFEVLECGQ